MGLFAQAAKNDSEAAIRFAESTRSKLDMIKKNLSLKKELAGFRLKCWFEITTILNRLEVDANHTQ